MNVTELSTTFPVGNLDHLLSDVEIPVLTGPQAQGDDCWVGLTLKAWDGLHGL